MTGVFQLFDRHQIVAGRRFPVTSPKRLPSGSPQFDNGIHESESSNSYQRPYTVEKHTNRIVQDKNRASTESSRDSFSSMSRSSSFSSLDCNINRTTHPEPDHIVFPDTPSRDSVTRQTNRQSVDLRDVVKDSMYRHKPTAKDESPDHAVDYRESLDTLAKFQEASWYNNEPRELSRSKSYQYRDGSSYLVPKDCPRFSYDGRETNRLSFQSQNNAKTLTSKQPEELRRLSLDSRDSSARSINTVSKAQFRNLENDGPIQSRAPSVVAKLMGLENFPSSGLENEKVSTVGPIRTSRVEDVSLLSKSLKAIDTFGPIKMHNSLRNSTREPTSPLWRNSEMKPISKFPMEPAPWKQREGSRSPQRPGSRSMRSPTKIHTTYSSVYSEVDKRLNHLEFAQSGKDLRALKQILEAMQSLEARKEVTQGIPKRQPVMSNNNSGGYESPIVIMKPAKLVEKSGMHVEEFSIDNRRNFTNNIHKSTRRDNVVNEVKVRGRQTTNAPVMTKQQQQQQQPKETATSSGKSVGSVSPRLQQKRLELERRYRPPTPPVNSNKMRKPLTKQVPESSSPGGRRRPRHTNVQQNDDERNEVGSESKKLIAPEEIDNRQSPSSIQEKSSLILREDESLDPAYPSPVSVLDALYMDDSPSHLKHMIKTLKDDATQEVNDEWETPNDVIPNTLSPVITPEMNRKKLQNIEHLVQKLTRLNSGHNEAQTDYIASLCENTKPEDRYISEILLASGLLLRDLGSSLTTFQFHSSGYPINPELFLVLEQTKFSNVPKQDPEKMMMIKKEKSHRKLIFDTVNEVLGKKLALLVPCIESFSRKSFRVANNKTLNAQKLLRDLCVEIEELLQVKKNRDEMRLDEEDEDDGLKSVLWEEVLNRGESWTDYDSELPVISLEVERLIFKDLVNEVVLGEAADGRRMKPGRLRCRKLFSK
ncbi:protein LONGIFOLIA 1-like [Rutidosis leptorrhynchoides]|uniref:protein LONGIFOLIA 1-like n=1 Tax=Rutidosis leptorrhynchoides TaxID=125765 RepID=UPI003A9997F4